MGIVAGKGDFRASGYVGAAIVNHHTTLSFQNFNTSATDPLEALLTINGNLAKRHIFLGAIPTNQSAFDLAVPEGTDISLFNTVILRLADPDQTDTVVGIATVP